MQRPANVRFSKSHEWATIDGDIATIGISDYAIELLTDLTHIELPEVGDRVEKGEAFGEVESVKAVAEIFSPCSGEVVEVNPELEENENFDILNQDTYNAGWLVKVKVTDPSDLEDLLDSAAYDKHCQEEQDEEED